MKLPIIAVTALLAIWLDEAATTTRAFAFMHGAPLSTATVGSSSSSSQLKMVLEKPKPKANVKKISKLEILKVESANLVHPLKEVRKEKETTGTNIPSERKMTHHQSR